MFKFFAHLCISHFWARNWQWGRRTRQDYNLILQNWEASLQPHFVCMKITVRSDLLAAKRRSRYTSGSSAGANWGMRRLLYRAWGHRWRYDKLMAPEDSDQPREKCKTFQRYIRLKDTARLWNYLFILRYLLTNRKSLAENLQGIIKMFMHRFLPKELQCVHWSLTGLRGGDCRLMMLSQKLVKLTKMFLKCYF